MSTDAQPFPTEYPENWRCQIGVMLFGITLWIPVTRRRFRKHLSAFVAPGSSVNNILAGLAWSNGAWVLRNRFLAYRVLSF